MLEINLSTKLFGQKTTNDVMAPGLEFAFGIPNEQFIKKAINNNWMLSNDSVVTPATINFTSNLDIKALVEPIAGLKINLNARRISLSVLLSGQNQTVWATSALSKYSTTTEIWRQGVSQIVTTAHVIRKADLWTTTHERGNYSTHRTAQ